MDATPLDAAAAPRDAATPTPAPDAEACYNCGARLHGPFCSACGQEALPLSPSLRDVVREATHELLDVDGRTIRSVKALFLAPGLLTREQFAGRRVPWLSPLKLYLIFSVAYFAMTALAGSTANVTVKGSDVETDAALRRIGFQDEAQFRQAIGRAQAEWMPRVMFVLVPVFAGLVHVMRRGSGRTFPQDLQFALHAHAAWFGVNAIVAAAPLAHYPPLTRAASGIVMIYGFVYVAMALHVAYGGTRWRALWQTTLILAIYGLLVALATLAIILPLIRPLMNGAG